MSDTPKSAAFLPDDHGSARPSLTDYILVIAKYKTMVLFITVAAVVIASVYAFMLPDVYSAKTMVFPGEEDKGMVGAMVAQLGGVAGAVGGLGGNSKAELYVTMLKSETVKDSIIDRFKLMQLYKADYRADAYNALDAKTTISLGKKDGVITITMDEADPKLAAAIANEYVEQLGKLASQLNMSKASDNTVFLEKRVAEARTNLRHAEDALKEFQTKNKAISVTDQAKATVEGVAQLRAQLALIEVELGALRARFTESSQEVKLAKENAANLQHQIAKLEGNGTGSSTIPSVGAMPQIGNEYLRLMREFKIQEALVEMLTKQLELSKYSQAKDVSPFQVLQRAKVPEFRSKPMRRKIVKIAAVFSFIFSVSFALFLEGVSNMPEADKQRWIYVFKKFKW